MVVEIHMLPHYLYSPGKFDSNPWPQNTNAPFLTCIIFNPNMDK